MAPDGNRYDDLTQLYRVYIEERTAREAREQRERLEVINRSLTSSTAWYLGGGGAEVAPVIWTAPVQQGWTLNDVELHPWQVQMRQVVEESAAIDPGAWSRIATPNEDEDDVIRVGDYVARMEEYCDQDPIFHEPGRQFRVMQVIRDMNSITIGEINSDRTYGNWYLDKFKKVRRTPPKPKPFAAKTNVEFRKFLGVL